MLTDVYALAGERTARVIDRFLTEFLPHRKPAADEYEVPQYADRPESVFTDPADLIRLCEARPDLEHAVYWNNVDREADIAAAHVFFLPDGGLILGLSTHDESPGLLLVALKRVAGTDAGYLTVEEPLAEDRNEFRRISREYDAGRWCPTGRVAGDDAASTRPSEPA